MDTGFQGNFPALPSALKMIGKVPLFRVKNGTQTALAPFDLILSHEDRGADEAHPKKSARPPTDWSMTGLFPPERVQIGRIGGV